MSYFLSEIKVNVNHTLLCGKVWLFLSTIMCVYLSCTYEYYVAMQCTFCSKHKIWSESCRKFVYLVAKIRCFQYLSLFSLIQMQRTVQKFHTLLTDRGCLGGQRISIHVHYMVVPTIAKMFSLIFLNFNLLTIRENRETSRNSRKFVKMFSRLQALLHGVLELRIIAATT